MCSIILEWEQVKGRCVQTYSCEAETPTPLAFSESSSLFMHLKMPFHAVKDWRGKGLVTEQTTEQFHIFAKKVTQIHDTS